MIHNLNIPFNELLDLFGINKNIIDEIDEAISSDIGEAEYYWFGEYLKDDNYDFHYIVREIIEDHIKYKNSVFDYVLNEIKEFFNNGVSCQFDDDITLEITDIDYSNDTVSFTLESDNLKSQIGQGMDAYGEWNWKLHSLEDQESFVESGYLALRELLHYYEACMSKPRVRLDKSVDYFWDYDVTITTIKEEIDAAKERYTKNSDE